MESRRDPLSGQALNRKQAVAAKQREALIDDLDHIKEAYDAARRLRRFKGETRTHFKRRKAAKLGWVRRKGRQANKQVQALTNKLKAQRAEPRVIRGKRPPAIKRRGRK